MQLAKSPRLFYLAYGCFKRIKPLYFHSNSSPKLNNTKNKLCAGGIVFNISIFTLKPNTTEENENVETGIKYALKEADWLYQHNKLKEAYQLLKGYEESSDVEALWRLCRVLYNMSQDSNISAEDRKSLVFEAFDVISHALALDQTHCENHKWMSILLDARTAYDGLKARISHMKSVKYHLLKAIELNPKDATALHILGMWCYQVANMPWYQRKIASALFETPPISSYEEALKYFIKAEEAEPRFYSQNLLMLGKTYLMLSKEISARYYLELASNYPISTEEDYLATKQASELLKKFKNLKNYHR